MDWKREYKLSDLFRRSKKERQRAIPPAGETGVDPPAAVGSPLDDVPIWKKEIKLSSLFRRKKSPKVPAGPLALPRAGDTVPEAPVADEPQVVFEPESIEAEPVAQAPVAPEVPVAAEPVPPEVSTSVEAQPVPTDIAETPPAPAQPEASEPPAQQTPTPEAPAESAPAAPAEAPAAEVAGTAVPENEVVSAPKVPWYKREIGGDKKPKQKPKAEARPKSKPAEDSGPKRREKQAQPKGDSAPERKPAKTGDLSRLPLMKAMNLLPKDVQLAKRSTVRPVFVQGAAVFAAVLVAGGVGLLYRSQHSTLHQKQGALEDVTAQVAEVQAEIMTAQKTALNGTSLAGEALNRATALSIPLNARLNWDRLLRELSLTLPPGVWFNTMQTNTATPSIPTTGSSTVTAQIAIPSGLTITGYAMDQDGVGRLLARLGVIPELSGVQLQTATETPLNGSNVISFTVIGELKPPAGAAASEAALQAAVAASQPPPTTTTDTTTSGSGE